MKKNNKKAFTLIELLIVIAIILFFFYIWHNFLGQGTADIMRKTIVKNFIVDTVNKISDYNFSQKTVSQELLTGNGNVNTKVSRFNNTFATLDHSFSHVAYYHWLYMTVNSNSSIDNTIPYWRNWYFYLIQYRQNWYASISPRRLLSFQPDPITSNQVIKPISPNIKWSEKYKIPTQKETYLVKIVNPNDDCVFDSTKLHNVLIIFSSWKLGFDFYWDWVKIPNFNYKLCFSEDPDRIEEGEKNFSILVNRENLLENFEESLQ